MISSQDFDRLSAYLDDQLSPKEKAALEARLAREPELKAMLDSLRQTVYALRALPVVRPPRNFTLTARQVGQVSQPQRRFFPALRLATSLAALTMVLVFAGDFLAGGSRALSPAAAPAPARNTTAERSVQVSEVAPQSAAVGVAQAPTPVPGSATDMTSGAAPSADATMASEIETPAAAVLAAAPVSTDSTAAAASAPAAVGGAAPTVADQLTPTEAPLAPAPAGAGELPQPTASAEPVAAAKAAPTQAAPEATAAVETPTASPAEPPAAANFAPTQEEPVLPAPAETEPVPPAPTSEAYQAQPLEQAAATAETQGPVSTFPWRLAEAGLIGLTLILAAATWLLRRR